MKHVGGTVTVDRPGNLMTFQPQPSPATPARAFVSLCSVRYRLQVDVSQKPQHVPVF